jgi:hypothetical protein
LITNAERQGTMVILVTLPLLRRMTGPASACFE